MTRTAKAAAAATPAPAAVRCAVYTRKSTEDGLDQAFNSLDAQRDAGEAYVKSQAGEGWAVLPARYDDGGFSGATADRPALRRLLADVEAGRVDCVVVYKVDRLSRSLPDFARLMETFDKAKVSFVSVTQQFNTATSMGRLVLNVLLSFAQFEREIISERTRDKIAATRRKGKWTGGHPVLGYDVDPAARRLVVNDAEADRVRAVFALYLDHGALCPVVDALAARGWRTKARATRDGRARGGHPFTRAAVYHLLTNPVYAGKVRYKDEVHPGEHPAVVAADTWAAVQARLVGNGRAGGPAARGRSDALLRGVLRYGPCDAAMTPTHTARGAKRYRYYVCSAARKHARGRCPSKPVPAGAVEDLVAAQVAAAAREPGVVAAVVAAAGRADDAAATALDGERRRLARDARGWRAELAAADAGRAADLRERIAAADRRAVAAGDELAALRAKRLDGAAVGAALGSFGPVWAALDPGERARAVRLVVDTVTYDGARETVAVAFRPAGVASLAREGVCG